MESLLSFRPALADRLAPLARALGLEPGVGTEVLVEAVVQVSSFHEEGFPLAPVVFIGRGLEELLQAVHGTHPVLLGSGVVSLECVRLALRSCAPLAEGRQWAIVLLVGEGQLQFGVFCTDRSPLRVTSFEALRTLPADAPPLVGITSLGERVVGVRGPGGANLFFDFSGTAHLESGSPMRVLADFVEAVTRDVPEPLRPQLRAFYYRIGVEVVSGAHGALVAVLDARAQAPDFLSDGLWLAEPLDLTALALRYEAEHGERDALGLIAYGSLYRRMIGMDGITVFDSRGRLLGYNCFIRQQVIGQPARKVVGGARRRAFEVLCGEVGHSLAAALYRSRDGAAECRRAPSQS
ncbi:hypothetical protein FGE12_29350 [Aggregicoccus sp. 17bor-14]|uniref:hypothetical protein n=1 Tax=Myxococcaceae TaxID=31 RepID=UPI00129C8CF9|nr:MULTISPECIES: hypothetical protein [Myxococcaceae]MBF5046559.1 hypothetical protein [Simulacricoccus sp. 17bor-14]MRI92270.1 hypothetical protein [Aggregicoccus sp. 17bor-14]